MAAGLAAGLGLVLPVTVAVPAYAAGDSCDSVNAPDTQPTDRPDPSEPVAELRIEQAHDLLSERGRGLGAGVVVAVVDSGIAPGVLPRVVVGPKISSGAELTDWHGTAVAGIIAGPDDGSRTIGIAPEATLVDVRVLDTLTPDEGESGLSTEAVTRGLQALADDQAKLQTDIVVVPRPVADDDALEAAVEALAALDVIVVAASGDRPEEESEPLYDDYAPDEEAGEISGELRPGEDAARDAYPAGYELPTVVAAGSTAPEGVDLTDSVLQSSAIDVAAPTLGAVGYRHERRALRGPRSRHRLGRGGGRRRPGPDREQLARRHGRPGRRPALRVGHRRTRHHAQQRAHRPRHHPADGGAAGAAAAGANGQVDSSRVRDRGNVAVDVPEPEPDVLAGTRKNAVWWGLLGGGALLVAVVLRPVLARRRR